MSTIQPKYKRILLKLSGEALAEGGDGILNFDFVTRVGEVLRKCLDLGVEIGVIVGAGNVAAYNSLIAELTGTGKCGSNKFLKYHHNLRKIKFLDPNTNFDPAIDYNAAANIPYLWRDPWGNPYTIMVNVDGKERLARPDDDEKFIMGKTAVYSYGPNGEDNQGKNASEGGDKLDDDIATWHK